MAARRGDAQLELFARTGQADRGSIAVGPAPIRAEIAGLAERLPVAAPPSAFALAAEIAAAGAT